MTGPRRHPFAVTPVEVLLAEVDGDVRLRRALGPVALTALGVGAIIGAGIFVLTGLAARELAGPALTLSFIVAAVGCALAGLCYAELAALVPVAGSAYTYAYATLGELPAWLVEWSLVLEYAVGAGVVARGWSRHLVSLLTSAGIPLSTAWTTTQIDLPAALVVLALTLVLVVGIRLSAAFNGAMVLVKLFVVAVVIVVGARYLDPAHWRPYAPFGTAGILRGAAYIFFAYIGFDAVSTHAEEARNPQRDVPIGIVGSLAICTLLYVLTAAVLTGMVPYGRLDVGAPVVQAFAERGLGVATAVIAVGALVGMTSVLLVLLLSQARILLAMARDGLLSARLFTAVHRRYRTPHRATIATGVAVACVAAVAPLEVLAELVNMGTLLVFVAVCAAVPILRWTAPASPVRFARRACRSCRC